MRSFTGHLITTWGRQTVFHKCPPLLSDAFTSQGKKKVKMENKGLRGVCVPQHVSRCTSKSGLNKTGNFYFLQAVACYVERCALTPPSKAPAPRRCSTSLVLLKIQDGNTRVHLHPGKRRGWWEVGD